MSNNYELGYTPANLNRIMAKANLTNVALGKLLGVNDDTICRWRTPLGRDRHTDMPALRWLQAVNICEADYEVCLGVLKDKILNELIGQNLVYCEGQIQPIHIICRYRGRGKWMLFTRHGPSSDPEDYSLEVGIEAGYIDYINEEGTDEEIENESSDVFVERYCINWARKLMGELGPFSWDGKEGD